MTVIARTDRHRRLVRREALTALPFLLPWLLGLVLFFVYPLLATVALSFAQYDQFNPPQFVGIQNWIYVLSQYRPFGQALGNTVILILLMVPSSTIFALVTGMVVMRLRRGAGVFRTLFYLPYLAPPVAATLAFVFLLSPRGALNQFLALVGIEGPKWFNDPATAKIALTLLTLWGIGNLMVIFLAALLDVPQEQYEASSLDGAGPIAQFWYITLPALRPIVLFSVITGVIATMQYYTQAIVAGRVASGQSIGPGTGFVPGYPGGSTLTLPQLIYSFGFQNFDVGSASVVAVIMMAIALALTATLLRRGSAFLGEGE
ncbi:sugar ABC transporter permease [soil metagenome]